MATSGQHKVDNHCQPIFSGSCLSLWILEHRFFRRRNFSDLPRQPSGHMSLQCLHHQPIPWNWEFLTWCHCHPIELLFFSSTFLFYVFRSFIYPSRSLLASWTAILQNPSAPWHLLARPWTSLSRTKVGSIMARRSTTTRRLAAVPLWIHSRVSRWYSVSVDNYY